MDNNKPLFLKLSRDDQKAAIEALIFASEEPLTLDSLFKILIADTNAAIPSKRLNGNGEHKTNVDNDEAPVPYENKVDYEQEAKNKWDFSIALFEELITEINIELINTNRPFQIVEVGGGYQFSTLKEYGELIYHLMHSRPKRRFSNAALECLAIIAYRQPVTKPEIDQIRGVNSNEVINSLVDKELVMPVGQKETIGKPWMFGTTNNFLKAFGLNSLEELPKLRELDEVVELLKAENPNEDILIDITFDDNKDETNADANKNEDMVTDDILTDKQDTTAGETDL